MSRNSGQSFTTMDRHNDRSSINCAVFANGAWWYDMCLETNLNGLYYTENPTPKWNGITWTRWKGNYYSLKSTTMKVKRV